MKIPKRIKKLLNTSIDTLVVMGIIGAVLLVGVYWLFPKLGLFSYNGMTREHVREIYGRLDKHYEVLSRVHGKIPFTNTSFTRGIYLPKQGGSLPIYYHYLDNGNDASIQIYPQIWAETWTTDRGFLGLGKLFTGDVVI